MSEPERYPYKVTCVFASGTELRFTVTCSPDEAHRLRKGVHDREVSITVGDAAHDAIVLDASRLDYFNIERQTVQTNHPRSNR